MIDYFLVSSKCTAGSKLVGDVMLPYWMQLTETLCLFTSCIIYSFNHLLIMIIYYVLLYVE